MNRYTIKNCILIMLVLVNLFLLFLVISKESKSRELSLRREEALRLVYAEKGISLDPDLDLEIEAPNVAYATRSLFAEKSAVNSLLGSTSTSDLGGSIIYYDGSHGGARFRGTGEFELVLDPGIIKLDDDPAAASAAAMKKLGFKSSNDSAEIRQESEGPVVSFYLTLKDKPVFNCVTVCHFVSGSLNIMEGRVYFDNIHYRDNYQELPDSFTILTNFLEHLRSSGKLCTKVTGLEAGYLIEASMVNECVLNPVWKITTDTGDFYFDGVTGMHIQPDIRK